MKNSQDKKIKFTIDKIYIFYSVSYSLKSKKITNGYTNGYNK